MGYELEIYRDPQGNNHLVFDKSALYDDSQIGDKLEDFEVLRILGSFNNTNPISKVRCLKNNKIYSMKKIDLNQIQIPEEKKLFEDQMKKLISLNHHHLIKYYKTFLDKENNILYLVYEFMNNSDLNSLIKAHAIIEKPIKEEIIWNILLQCLSGINYLHKENLASLAIKPTNIYLNNEQNAKISLFFKLPKLSDKDYDIQNDILLIGKYFYKMCFFDQVKIDAWIEDIKVEKKPNSKYSPELMNIIYTMTELNPGKKNITELFPLVKDEYVRKYTKVTSIDSLLRCLYSLPDFNQAISKQSNFIEYNKSRCYISYWFLLSIRAIKDNSNLKVCYEEFRRVLAAANSKIDCSKEVDPIFLFSFLLEKMHKELNKKKTSIVKNSDENEHYVINSIYRMEEKDDKTNKTEMWNKFDSYNKENLNSVVSNLFYGIIKSKRVCPQCKNGFYSFNHTFCSAFNLLKHDVNTPFDLKTKIDRIILVNTNVCEVCLTEQKFNEFDDIYKMAKHLIICFYRGINYQNNTQINFDQFMDFTEKKGLKVDVKQKFELIGAINRSEKKTGEEEFTYFCRSLDNPNQWKTRDGNYNNGCPLNDIKSNGQIIMLFYNKCQSND